ncbi:MAG TPA: NAD-dependent epimerase/dehydratase family protein [Bacteroidales bacterium]|nr:NAD-dependent epimerase/dehydratase family protein [Bacteroidales bacterium]
MNKSNILVTGGAGFLGSHIVKELFHPDSPVKPEKINVLDLKDYQGDHNVNFIKGDIRDYDTVKKACEGMEAVIHSAAVIDWGTHSPQYVYDVNVGGTENVIRACQELGIRFLVYTSSLDALYTGKPLRNVDDHQPYPKHFHNMYCKSKVFGEQRVMAANNDALKTTIMRPCDIYGPSDPYHMNALIGMAKTGFYVKLGNGKAKTQHVFVGNMAYAHVLALSEMMNGNGKLLGQAYLITDSEPENFFKFFEKIVSKAGYRIWPKNAWIPWGIAYPLGAISESIAVLARPFVRYNPGLSRFAVNYTSTDYTFKSERAREHFGFLPKYTEEEAIEITAAFYRKK